MADSVQQKKQNKKQLIEQATKATQHILHVDIELKSFDSLILPILLYCCEVWGFEKLEDRKVHLTFCNRILCVKNNTLNFMIYGVNLAVSIKV